MVPKQFSCISVHFGFGIGNQDGLTSADGREKSISDDSSGLHRAAGTKDSTVPIESGVFWETNKLSFLFAQDHASSFVRGGQLQDRFQFLFGHPTGSAIDSGFALGKATGIVFRAAKLVMKLQIEDQRCACGKDEENRLDTIQAESMDETNKKAKIRRREQRSIHHATGIHPTIVVGHQLTQQATNVEQCNSADTGSKDDRHTAMLFIHSYFSNLLEVLPPHCPV